MCRDVYRLPEHLVLSTAENVMREREKERRQTRRRRIQAPMGERRDSEEKSKKEEGLLLISVSSF